MDLVTVDYHADNAPEQFVKSLREFGFAVLNNHPIQTQEVARIYQDWLGFFNSTSKRDYRFGDRYDGYFPPEVSETAKGHTTKDIKEYFHFY
ncbi:MAG: hypothetical protein RLZZ422_2106, partial [Pseudomonadota bacterium]